MNENSPLESLQHIEKMMEKSTQFKSISPLTGVVVGLFALVASYFINQIRLGSGLIKYYDTLVVTATVDVIKIIVALLVVSIVTALGMSIYKANKNKEAIFTGTSKRLAFSLLFPLIGGAIFLLKALGHLEYYFLWSGMLLFYGFALINASKYSLSEIHYLGIFQVTFAIVGLLLPQYSFLMWVLGLGVVHIVFGMVMFLKNKAK